MGYRPALFNQDDLVALRTKKGIHCLTPGVTGWESGFCFCGCGRHIGAAKIVLTLGFLTLTALSFSVVADPLIKPLEL